MKDNSMVGETVWCKLKGQPVKMLVVESQLVYESDRRGVELVMRRPKGAIYFEGFLPMGAQHVEQVRESTHQDPIIDRSLRGF